MKKLYLLYFFCCCYVFLNAQSSIQGYVQDEAGQPLNGANVVVISNNQGSLTDEKGYFSVMSTLQDTLQITLLGYETLWVLAEKANDARLTLAKGIKLKTVVVTALDIKREKDALTYAHTEVNTEPLSMARTNNLGDALAGTVPGLSVSNIASGAGGSTRLLIRGYHSVSQDNQPMIVLDGIPIDNSTLGSASLWGGQDWGDGLSSINPDDIAKITVLRGNAATALYGSRASNGVILMTTKRGNKRNGIGVELNSNFTVEQAINHRDFQKEYRQGWGPWKPGTQDDAFSSNWFSWGPKLDGTSVVQFDGIERPYAAVPDNFKNFYKNGYVSNNNISLTGGNEKLNFRFGFSHLDNAFVIPNSGFKRQTYTLAAGGEVVPGLTTEITARYITEEAANRPRLSDSPGNANYAIAVLPNHVPVEALAGENGDGSVPNGSAELGMNVNPFITNPYWAIHRFRTDDSQNRIIGSVLMRYEREWFYIQGRIGRDFFNNRRSDLTPSGTAYQPTGSLIEQSYNVSQVNADFMLGSKHHFASGFGYDIFVGGNRMDYSFENTGLFGGDFNIEGLETIQNTQNQSSWYNLSRRRVNSLLGAANFSYNNWLYLSFTGRNDWFSTLPTNANNLFYPSVGTSLVFSELLNLPNAVSYVKLYGSWAKVSGDVDPYSLDLTYQLVAQGFQGQALGIISNYIIPDRNLAPSISEEVELGMNLQFFKNRLGLDVTLYNRQTQNDIIVSSISNASGYEFAYVKEGAMDNKGIEANLSITPFKTQKAFWTMSLNAAYNQNTVQNLGEGIDDIQIDASRTFTAFIHHEVGQPASVIKGFAYQRDEAGNIILNEAGQPLKGDYTILGQGVHPFAGGFRNIIQWRNLSLDVLIDAKLGGDIYSATNAYAYTFGQHKNTLVGRENGFILEGVYADGSPNTLEIKNDELLGHYSYLTNNITEEFVYDADFAKLRRVVLSYQLPEKWMLKLPFREITLSAVGQNLALLYSKVPNVDPESTYNNTNAQGLEMFGAPQTRTFGGNLRIKF